MKTDRDLIIEACQRKIDPEKVMHTEQHLQVHQRISHGDEPDLCCSSFAGDPNASNIPTLRLTNCLRLFPNVSRQGTM